MNKKKKKTRAASPKVKHQPTNPNPASGSTKSPGGRSRQKNAEIGAHPNEESFRQHLEAFVRKKLRDPKRECWVLERIRTIDLGPLDSPKAGRALIELSRHAIEDLGFQSLDDFGQKVFGWPPGEITRLLELYKQRRWKEAVLNDKREAMAPENQNVPGPDALPAPTATEIEPIKSAEFSCDYRLEDHPFASVLPLMNDEELQALADDIRRNGLRESIVLFEGKILDGRNRYHACLLAGIKPHFINFEGSDPLAFVLSKNLHRRHLTKSQCAAIAAELLSLVEEEARRRKELQDDPARNNHGQFAKEPEVEKIPPADANGENDPQPSAKSESLKSREIAAKALDVNARYVSDAKRVRTEAPDLHEQVKEGKITLAQAKTELEKQRQPKEIDQNKDGDQSDPPPFTVILRDESAGSVPIPKILTNKNQRKTLRQAVQFHLTGEPTIAFGSKSKDGFRDAAIFVILGDEHEHTTCGSEPILQKQSCLFLVVRVLGDIPKPHTLPEQVIEGGVAAAREMIEKMWPAAHRVISDGNEAPPKGWHAG